MGRNQPVMVSNVSPPVRSALSGLIDYAGLFPTAKLSMADAHADYRAAREQRAAWMLGRFVVPLSRLEELQTCVSGDPVPVSAILDAENDPLRWFACALWLMENAESVRDDRRVRIEAIEVPLPRLASARETYGASIGQVAALIARYDLGEVPTYLEFPRDERWQPSLSEAVTSLARHGLRAKVRCGGIVAQAFPSCEELAAFIISAARAGVPFRATAGLHHPVRHFDATVGCLTHGFLNLFAATLVALHDDDPAGVEATLGEEDAAAFRFDDAGFSLRNRRFDQAAIASARQRGFVSYGSCSFDEPVADLTAMGILDATAAP